MIYGKPVPRIDNILWLSKLAEPYPSTCREIREIAEEWRFSKSTMDFLHYFDEDQTFESRSDFISQAKVLEDEMFKKRGAFIAASHGFLA